MSFKAMLVAAQPEAAEEGVKVLIKGECSRCSRLHRTSSRQHRSSKVWYWRVR